MLAVNLHVLSIPYCCTAQFLTIVCVHIQTCAQFVILIVSTACGSIFSYFVCMCLTICATCESPAMLASLVMKKLIKPLNLHWTYST